MQTPIDTITSDSGVKYDIVGGYYENGYILQKSSQSLPYQEESTPLANQEKKDFGEIATSLYSLGQEFTEICNYINKQFPGRGVEAMKILTSKKDHIIKFLSTNGYL